MRLLALALAVALGVMVACDDGPTLPDAPFDLAPFQQLARDNAECGELENELFLLDSSYVLWHRRGECLDAQEHFALYGSSPSVRICEGGDSIGGWGCGCLDPALTALFDVICANGDDPDFGIVPPHVLEPIPY